MSGPYDDIIHLPHHVSITRPQMSRSNRAAQFSPFAALTGYGAAIQETARYTDERIVLDENAIADLDKRLGLLAANMATHPQVSVTYFQADERKAGGAYVTAVGRVKKLDDVANVLVLLDSQRIPVGDILAIESGVI